MSQWFDWLFNSKESVVTPVKSEGEIFLEDNKAVYVIRKGYRQTAIDLSQLQYIYLYITKDCQNLVLNDYYQHFIPCSISGFEIFFQHLSSRFLLDEKKFREISANHKPAKVELWRANSPDNCRILESSNSLALHENQQTEGFWICSVPRQWIAWDMTSQELAALPDAYQSANEYGVTEIRFDHPAQIGNLILDDWRYYFPGHLRPDVPLDSFYSNVRINGNGDQNYFLAKKALGEILGETISVYEREDQNSCHWIVDGIKFVLIYWYDSRFSYQSGYSYLNVKNERTYPDYLTDPAYELNLNISKILFLERSFAIGSDFRRSRYFQQTPRTVAGQLLVSPANFIIWLDEPNGKIGFANLENAMIFPLEILVSLECQNVLPDRSSGGIYLSAILKGGDKHSILIGDCYAFDTYVHQLAEMIQLPIVETTAYE